MDTAAYHAEPTRLLSTYLTRMAEKGGYLIRIYPVVIGEGVIQLPPKELILGRDKECALSFDDPDVSRRHASIDYQDGQYFIADLGSTNGTIVNNQKIENAALRSGDLVRIGKTILKFLRGSDVETQYHETVYSMMINDGLTGIPNKRFFLDALNRELTRSQRHKRPLSLVVFDIDRFKQINDKFGHLAGDVVLREMAARIRATIRKDEVFARYGGEEFVVLLPEASLDSAAKCAERIRMLVADAPITAPGVSIPITISLGVGHVAGESTLTPEEFFETADKKLYEAKAAGRNRVVA